MVDMKIARKGDYILFANGVKGQITVIYPNGGYFLRWDEFDANGKKQPWSGSDSHCCWTAYPANARTGYKDTSELYVPAPYDIVEIMKPPLEELQDEIEKLQKHIKTLEKKP